MIDSRWLILLAEDNEADVFLVRTALEENVRDFRLQVFEDGERVLEHLERIDEDLAPCPDVVLLDLNMPKVGGEEVLQRLRNSIPCGSTPVIVMTSSSQAMDKERAKALGITYFFQKPDDYDAFLRVGKVVSTVLETGTTTIVGSLDPTSA